jgi:hypothetical protein
VPEYSIGHVMSFVDLLLLEAFYILKPGRGAQRTSFNDVLVVHV